MISQNNKTPRHANTCTLDTLYLDFEKAFDKVCHKKLLDILMECGSTGRVINLHERHLTGRSQSAKVKTSTSFELNVKSGISQKLVLWPFFFFKTLINDLPSYVLLKCLGYAQDNQIIATNAVSIQIDATRVWKMCRVNMTKLNLDK